jgi:predicted transcriptional regulator YdeE
MQKYIDKGSELQIRSAIALDHLKNYIYVEADKEAHVREVLCEISIVYHTYIMDKIVNFFACVSGLQRSSQYIWTKNNTRSNKRND